MITEMIKIFVFTLFFCSIAGRLIEGPFNSTLLPGGLVHYLGLSGKDNIESKGTVETSSVCNKDPYYDDERKIDCEIFAGISVWIFANGKFDTVILL